MKSRSITKTSLGRPCLPIQVREQARPDPAPRGGTNRGTGVILRGPTFGKGRKGVTQYAA